MGIAPGAHDPAAVHNDATRTGASEQWPDDLAVRMVADLLTQIARHVINTRSLPLGLAPAGGTDSRLIEHDRHTVPTRTRPES